MHPFIIISILISVGILSVAAYAMKKNTELVPYILIALGIQSIIMYGFIGGGVTFTTNKVVVKAGEYDYAKSKYKYLIDVSYVYDGERYTKYFVGDDKLNYEMLTDSTDVVLLLHLNAYNCIDINNVKYYLVKKK